MFAVRRRCAGGSRTSARDWLRSSKARYPSEVQPLVDDLNALLAHNDQTVARARSARPGDLAHGLKTPLAMLSQGGRQRLEGTGDHELAAVIAQQVDR